MSQAKILIIEDEADIQELLRYNLTREQYELEIVATGEEGLRKATSAPPDLILLDLMLPGMDGLDTCKRLKAQRETQHIPVIMLTAKGEEADVVTGLELGAEDYVTKPFSPRVLSARIRAVVRRKARADEETEEQVVIRGGLRIDALRHEVRLNDRPLTLTATEFQVLSFLAHKPGWVFTRQQIVDAVKGADYAVTERAVDVQMVGLRKKLGESAEYIETVRGVGYRFKAIE